MPNTKSAERRVRSTERRRLRNRRVTGKLRRIEKQFRALVTAGKKAEAAAALVEVTSAYAKAAKSGIVHARTADRKKSRLALSVNRIK